LEIHEINKLCNSNIKPISKVGYYLYSLDTSKGLTDGQLKELISIIANDVGYVDAQIEDDLEEMYDKGFKEAEEECFCCCR